MKNSLINISIRDFKNIIEVSWNQETCYEPFQVDWKLKNPSHGQCYVTARLFQEIFGGDLIKVRDSNNTSHYWNILNGKEYDFTRIQYSPNEVFTEKEIVQDFSKNNRLDILRKNFSNELEKRKT